jgi:hypothetical protein
MAIKQYGPGQQLKYHECGAQIVVTVVENNSNAEQVDYRLRVDQMLSPTFTGATLEQGKIFRAMRIQEGMITTGSWNLEPY